MSESVRRRLAGDYWFPTHGLTVVHNGVDSARFARTPEARRDARRGWGVPESAFVFGAVGRFSEQKAYDVVLEAFHLIRDDSARRPAYLILVGDGPELPVLRERAHTLRLADRVLFPGFSSTPRSSYPGFDVFLIPSRYEGLPFALLEAMASGCEVIGTPVGGIPEVISTPALGTLVRPVDAGALAEAMRNALRRDTSSREATAARVHSHVSAHFDLGRQCLRIVHLLERLSASGPVAS